MMTTPQQTAGRPGVTAELTAPLRKEERDNGTDQASSNGLTGSSSGQQEEVDDIYEMYYNNRFD